MCKTSKKLKVHTILSRQDQERSMPVIQRQRPKSSSDLPKLKYGQDFEYCHERKGNGFLVLDDTLCRQSKSSIILNGKPPPPPHHRKKPKIKKKRSTVIANLVLTKYSVVRTTCVDAGMTIADTDTNECMFIWSDAAVPIDRITELKSYQKINHFPGMGEICRKDSLARNMSKMQKEHADDFSFVPQTWILPGEYPLIFLNQ